MLFILAGEEKGKRPLFRQRAQLPEEELLPRLAQLSSEACLERFPAFGLVPEPFPERIGRGKFLEPPIEGRLVFAQTPWPQAIDQDSGPIPRFGRFINALNLHAHVQSPIRTRSLYPPKGPVGIRES